MPYNVEMSTWLILQYMVANFGSESYKSIDLVCKLFILLKMLESLVKCLQQSFEVA